MGRGRRGVLVLLIGVGSLGVGSACGSATPSVPEPAEVRPGAVGERATEPAEADELPPTSPYGYAESPITDFADEVTQLALAALEERRLPETRIPLQPVREGADMVRRRPNAEVLPEAFDVVGFGLELDVVMRERGAGGGGRHGRLRCIVYLGRTGVRLAGLRMGAARSGWPLPEHMLGFELVATQILASLRTGTVSQLLVGEAERAWIGDAEVYRQVVQERPDPQTLERAETLAQETEEPIGYYFDDVGLLLRGSDGHHYSVRMDLDRDSDGVIRLDTTPLVRIRRVDSPEP